MGIYASDSIWISLATEQKRGQSPIQRGGGKVSGQWGLGWNGRLAAISPMEEGCEREKRPSCAQAWRAEQKEQERHLGTDQIRIQSTSFRGQMRLAQAQCQGASQRICVLTQADTA